MPRSDAAYPEGRVAEESEGRHVGGEASPRGRGGRSGASFASTSTKSKVAAVAPAPAPSGARRQPLEFPQRASPADASGIDALTLAETYEEVFLREGGGRLQPDEHKSGDPYGWLRESDGEAERGVRLEAAGTTLAACRAKGYTLGEVMVELRAIEDLLSGTRFVLEKDIAAPDFTGDSSSSRTLWRRHPPGRAVQVAQKLAVSKKVCLLNAANPYQLGGNLLGGGPFGQEEMLCLQSTLYPSLMVAQEAFRLHPLRRPAELRPPARPDGSEWQCMVPEDGVILSPSVEFLRGNGEEGCPFLETPVVLAGVVTLAMPNSNAEAADMPVDAPADDTEWHDVLRSKFIAAFGAARMAEAKTVVLSDIGCKDYNNHPADVGAILGQVLRDEFADAFKEIHVSGTDEYCEAIEDAWHTPSSPAGSAAAAASSAGDAAAPKPASRWQSAPPSIGGGGGGGSAAADSGDREDDDSNSQEMQHAPLPAPGGADAAPLDTIPERPGSGGGSSGSGKRPPPLMHVVSREASGTEEGATSTQRPRPQPQPQPLPQATASPRSSAAPSPRGGSPRGGSPRGGSPRSPRSPGAWDRLAIDEAHGEEGPRAMRPTESSPTRTTQAVAPFAAEVVGRGAPLAHLDFAAEGVDRTEMFLQPQVGPSVAVPDGRGNLAGNTRFEPLPGQVWFSDPRPGKAQHETVGITAFSRGERDEPWDRKCMASFLGNHYDMGPQGVRIGIKSASWWDCCACLNELQDFRNAEAAFHALQFWRAGRAHEFENLSGVQAAERSEQLVRLQDQTMAGFSSSFAAMLHVLRAKFAKGSAYAAGLLKTGDDFLLHHEPFKGDDAVWSDDFDGAGTNWLGMQLMLIREELRVTPVDEDTVTGDWTPFIESCVDGSSGVPLTNSGARTWQATVMAASLAVRRAQKPVTTSADILPNPLGLPVFAGFCEGMPCSQAVLTQCSLQ